MVHVLGWPSLSRSSVRLLGHAVTFFLWGCFSWTLLVSWKAVIVVCKASSGFDVCFKAPNFQSCWVILIRLYSPDIGKVWEFYVGHCFGSHKSTLSVCTCQVTCCGNITKMSPILLINEIQILIYVTCMTASQKMRWCLTLCRLYKTQIEHLGREGLLKSYQGLINIKFKWLSFLSY